MKTNFIKLLIVLFYLYPMESKELHLTLSQLNDIIQSKLNEAFFMQHFWIVAHITEHSFKQKTGYHYFELVEKDLRTNACLNYL